MINWLMVDDLPTLRQGTAIADLVWWANGHDTKMKLPNLQNLPTLPLPPFTLLRYPPPTLFIPQVL